MAARWSRILTCLLAAVALSACGGQQGGIGATGDTDGATGETTVADAPESTTEPEEGGGDEGTDQLEQQCTHESDGFQIRYPRGWHADPSCEWFHPEPFDLPENQDVTGIAIHVRQEPVPIDRVARGGPMTEVLSRSETQFDGRRAVRSEVRMTREGLMPAGTRGYHWTVDLGAGGSLRGSTFSTGNNDYDRNRKVLDQMMQSVELGPPEDA